MSPQKYRKVAIEEVLKDLENGLKIVDIARKYGISRDTVERRLKDAEKTMGSRVNDARQTGSRLTSQKVMNGQMCYAIGEALIGREPELAHIDLVIGDKWGPVGQSFTNGLANLSAGHTPLLAVIRPNLPPKPYTLIVPKVTVKDFEQIGKIFGPSQAAVAKAVADSVEEGIIPRDKVDDWVIICSVFVHPEAKDYRSIYHYNYSATKLAIKRALTNYPPIDKIMYDKDRAKHPIMNFRVPRLWMPPYLQIALDVPDIERVKKIINELPTSDRLILEAGTPLIKKYGVNVLRDLREIARDSFIVADLKTLDVGQVEVDLAYDETADAVVVSGLASRDTIDKFIYETKRFGIYSIVDMMSVANPLATLRSLRDIPDIVILHRGIDEEHGGKTRWELIREIKDTFKEKQILFAVAGGIDPITASHAIKSGADILIVGRYITQSKDVKRAAREFLELIGPDMDLLRVHVE
ncbi:MAG: bifunctional 5,6,7,8-tetrahydromethanopterin hydro-lyase/3-hexulose-6-phosphate synthase [Candidatus Bathyarchaeota archaeon]